MTCVDGTPNTHTKLPPKATPGRISEPSSDVPAPTVENAVSPDAGARGGAPGATDGAPNGRSTTATIRLLSGSMRRRRRSLAVTTHTDPRPMPTPIGPRTSVVALAWEGGGASAARAPESAVAAWPEAPAATIAEAVASRGPGAAGAVPDDAT